MMLGRLQWFFLASFLGHGVCYVTNKPQPYDAIVIGLGSAGTTAASTLAKAGKRVLALEAQDRVGGRVWTVPFGDGVVEVGAEWIHGTGNSTVYELAVKNNIPVVPQHMTVNVYNSDGTTGNVELIDELIEFVLEAEENPPEKPEQLGKFLTRQLKEYLKQKHPELLEDQEFVDELLELMDFIINGYEATSSWNDATTHTNFEDLEGNQSVSWHRYGWKTFFELLLNTYNNGPGWPTLEIKLNTEVTQIKWPKNSTGTVEVLCKDGAVYTADSVIVTVSLGVLKERYLTLFTPPLPDAKVTAIDKVSIGVVGKTIFTFPEKWWPDLTAFMFFWSADDKKVYKDDQWMLTMKQVYKPMGSNDTLAFWANGETAKLIETLPEDVVKSKMMEILRKFMGKNITIPEPTAMIRSKWYSNPFTRGTYTYDNVLTPEYPNARATLAEPLLDVSGSPKVQFAGEATHSTRFSTVHGASETGYREATRILNNNKVE